MRQAASPGRCNGGPTATTTVATAASSSVAPSISGLQAQETAFSYAAPNRSTPALDLLPNRSIPALDLPPQRPSSSELTSVVSTSPRNNSQRDTPIRAGITARTCGPISPRLVLPDGPETDLTDINSLLLDINQLDNSQAGGVGCGPAEGIPLCSLSPGGLTAKGSPARGNVSPLIPPSHRRGGHSARGSLAEDDTGDPEGSNSAIPSIKAAQVCTKLWKVYCNCVILVLFNNGR